MKFQSAARLAVEDFDDSQQELITKLAAIYNPMVDSLNIMFAKQIDFDNLNQQVLTLTAIVNASGVPTQPLQVATSLKTQAKGILAINAINTTDATPLTGGISFMFTNNTQNLITITQITGIPADKKFNLVVILIG